MTIPLLSHPIGFLFFSLDGPVEVLLLYLRGEGSPSLHSLTAVWERDHAAHTVSAPGRNHPSPADPSAILHPEVDRELTKLALQHLLYELTHMVYHPTLKYGST